MYIEKIKIDKFRVLEDIEIHFQPPCSETADSDTGNVVNVIAGVNGCGKTTVLEAIYSKNKIKEKDEIKKLQVVIASGRHNGKGNVYYFPASLELTYNEEVVTPMFGIEVLTDYKAEKVSSKGLLSKAENIIKEFVIGEERKLFESDPIVRKNISINRFNDLFSDINVGTKLFELDVGLNGNKPVFKNDMVDRITINQLSDGEKQLYGRVVWLLGLNPSNAIILIDEPEIALHPAWQQKLCKFIVGLVRITSLLLQRIRHKLLLILPIRT